MKQIALFYYSAKQWNAQDKHRRMCTFMRKLFSKQPHEYTEMVTSFPFWPSGKWDDYRFVGIGYFAGVE